MESLIITPADNEELALVKAVLEKMNLKIKVLSDEEKEDMGLAFLMSQADRNKTIPREEVMKKLGK
ncbi:MAG: hypothetical protein WA958_09125 [Tunicatimonas sp.]